MQSENADILLIQYCQLFSIEPIRGVNVFSIKPMWGIDARGDGSLSQ